ncbi:MAG: WD repeat-containing protein [Comamonadaceae bacterium]|nr:MAG: WD repeat-containing protein [Comamonadaceae bacterium]
MQAQDLEQISAQAGRALLRTAGVVGTDAELLDLAQRFGPHALAVSLLGVYLYAQPGHGVAAAKAVEDLPGAAPIDRVLAAFERLLGDGPALETLRLLGLFDRPADAACLSALRQTPLIPCLNDHLVALDAAAWRGVLARLEKLRLVQVQDDGAGQATVDAHPLIREHFAAQLQGGEAWRAGHQRLFEHLCASTKEGDSPTLQDLLPLYQAVAHGCLAGLQQRACDEVYYARICRGGEAYSTRKLGAFSSDLGAVACFFEQPWQRVSASLTEDDQAWLLNQAAFRLRALGRLGEALEPMQAGLQMLVQQEKWKQAAAASNLSELALTLGHILGEDPSSALQSAAQAVVYADRSGDAFLQMAFRTTHADALHQAGQQTEALQLFREAEAMQVKDQPSDPLLYSVQGFQYADLLLASPERAAWCACLQPAGDHPARLIEVLDDVEQRASKALAIVLNGSRTLLDIALNHLTLVRTALYMAVLQAGILDPTAPAWVASGRIATEINQAVDGLRSAGQQDQIPRALLTRAWLRHLQGHTTGPNSAQTDLDEAWEIAERGPMPLFQTDIYLHRARLFLHQLPYPWHNADGSPRRPQDDLAAARQLIFQHGYLRRQEELQDAEAAAGVTVLNHPV